MDHCFQKAGFDKNSIFYTQGDYGLFQCSEPCHKETYDNEETIKKIITGVIYKQKAHSPERLIKPKKDEWQNHLLLTLQNSGEAEYIIPC